MEEIIKHQQNKSEEELYTKIFVKFDQKLKSKAYAASNRALNHNVYIPPEDFFSYFQEAIWKSIVCYWHRTTAKYNFQQVVKYQIHLAEIRPWRDYQNKGTKSDKNQIQYLAAKYTPLKSNIPNVHSGLENMYIKILIKEFSTKEPSAGIIIQMLATEYKSKEIVKLLYNTNEYRPKYRKRINRARKLLKKYLESNI